MAKVAVIVGAASKHDKDGTDVDLPPASRWGLGGALCLRFAQGGFHVALLGRRVPILDGVAKEVQAIGGTATCIQCDVEDNASVKSAFDAAKSLGTVEVVVYNVAPPFPPGCDFTNLPMAEVVDPEYFTRAFNIGVSGCVRCVREIAPDMMERGRGTILLSGATMALRGGPKFACMAPIKAALRSYGQAMYQTYAPKGVHVAHVVIDGVIESPNTKAWADKVMLQDPADLADAFFAMHEQKPSAWSYEMQLTPCRESVGMRL
ncbi:budC [Symbiodinium natans]|uniref:BudC protein n=1 Tax=Symbiodinium natans TaxID=878477 RepID=A0A812PUX5_9DINO|nr:budC [Symbiodinium natans]